MMKLKVKIIREGERSRGKTSLNFEEALLCLLNACFGKELEVGLLGGRRLEAW